MLADWIIRGPSVIQSACCVCLYGVCYSRAVGGGYMRNQILTSKYIGSMYCLIQNGSFFTICLLRAVTCL